MIKVEITGYTTEDLSPDEESELFDVLSQYLSEIKLEVHQFNEEDSEDE